MKILQLTLLLTVAFYADGQLKTYTRAQLQSDFNLARHALEESHPGMYRFMSKEDLDKQFDNAYASIRETMTAEEFYKLIAPPVLSIGCGHTSVRSDSIFAKLLQNRFPFDIRIIGQRNVYVSRSYSRQVIAGLEIISIDGIPILDMINSFLPYISRDGFIMTGRYNAIERNFSLRVQLNHKASSYYMVAFKGNDGKTMTKKIELVASTDIPRPKENPALEYRVVNKTGIITIRSFDGSVKDASDNNYNTFLESAFTNLHQQNVESLVIDLRGNGGGNDEYGALLFGYLSDKPFEYYRYLEINKPTMSFLKYTDQSSSFRDQMVKITNVKDGRYFLNASSHRALPVQQPQSRHFDKPVYVLIDGRSFSATAEFAAIARFNKRAFFIGEETGGAYEGNTSGYGVLLTLPNTGIGIRLPMLKYVTAVEPDPQPKGRGIMPDLEIFPTIGGIISGRDEVMEQTIAKAGGWTNEPRK